jgi:uncharacterized SAM-binding protein YcdF (DUF218 family)
MRALRWVAWGAGALVLVTGVTTFAMWPRDDIPRDPDAVVVLGGAGPERAQLGIGLRDRYGATLVLSASAIHFARAEGIGCGDPDVLCIFEPEPETTVGEARRVAELADEHGWDHVTVVTTRFHTTRARVLFRQCLGDDVSVAGAVAPGGGRGLRTYLEETAGTVAGLTFRRAC